MLQEQGTLPFLVQYANASLAHLDFIRLCPLDVITFLEKATGMHDIPTSPAGADANGNLGHFDFIRICPPGGKNFREKAAGKQIIPISRGLEVCSQNSMRLGEIFPFGTCWHPMER